MTPKLSAFLARSARTPFAWAGPNCLTWLGDWAMELTGVDPIADLRWACQGRRSALALVRRAGGLSALLAQRAALAGYAETDAAQAGDVGVVEIMGEAGPDLAGAICTGPRWAMLARVGLVVASVQPLRAWRVC